MKNALWFGMSFAIGVAVMVAQGRAQDTFVPTHGKAACEFWSGTSCAPVGRPRTRIVRVPVTTMKPMRHVPEHLAPLRREPEVRVWRRHWDDRDRVAGWRSDMERGRELRLRERDRCWPVRMEAQSDEKVARDAMLEAERRWSGVVRAKLGELYMDVKNAKDKRALCWQSSTGERMTDKMTGGTERCSIEARPCRAEKSKDSDDDH